MVPRCIRYTGDLLETVPGENRDKMFEVTTKHVENAITQNYALPKPLMGSMPDGGVFNVAAISDSYVYFNSRTKNARNKLGKKLNKLGSLMVEPLDFGEIETQKFVDEKMPTGQNPSITGKEGPEEEVRQETKTEEDES